MWYNIGVFSSTTNQETNKMPRALSTDKFFHYAPKKSGSRKGRILLGVNHAYAGNKEDISLPDLLDYLGKHNIDPSKVKVPQGYITTIKV